MKAEGLPFEDWGEKFGFFGISAHEARKIKIISDANGSILFIDSEIPEPQQGSKPIGKVIDITARIKERRAQEQTNKAIEDFKANYLPYLSREDVQIIVSAPEDQRLEVISKLCLKIDLERGVR